MLTVRSQTVVYLLYMVPHNSLCICETGEETGNFPDNMSRADFISLHQIGEAGYRMASQSSIDVIKAILIAEHNEVASAHRVSTPRETVEYARDQLQKMCRQRGIAFPPTEAGDVPDATREIIQRVTKMDKSTYFARLKIAMSPEWLWKQLCEVWDKNAKFELSGQKRGKNKVAAEISIRTLESMGAKLSDGAMGQLFEDLLEGKFKVRDLARRNKIVAIQERK